MERDDHTSIQIHTPMPLNGIHMELWRYRKQTEEMRNECIETREQRIA